MEILHFKHISVPYPLISHFVFLERKGKILIFMVIDEVWSLPIFPFFLLVSKADDTSVFPGHAVQLARYHIFNMDCVQRYFRHNSSAVHILEEIYLTKYHLQYRSTHECTPRLIVLDVDLAKITELSCSATLVASYGKWHPHSLKLTS